MKFEPRPDDVMVNVSPECVEGVAANLTSLKRDGSEFLVLEGSRYVNDETEPIEGRVVFRVVPND